jgi:hypothetical protein
MARSWGHRLLAIEPRSVERARKAAEEKGYACWGTCSGPKCREFAEYTGEYRYVTGRAGRVTTASRPYCPQHAKRFAEKHELGRLPVDPEKSAADKRAAIFHEARDLGNWREA